MNSKQIDIRLVGQAIKALRKRDNLTQNELADRIGYSVRNLRRLENCGTSSIDTVNAIAEAFGVSAISILNGCFLFMKKASEEWPLPDFSVHHLLQSVIRTCAL